MPPKSSSKQQHVYIITTRSLAADNNHSVALLQAHGNLDSANAAAHSLVRTKFEKEIADPSVEEATNADGGFTCTCRSGRDENGVYVEVRVMALEDDVKTAVAKGAKEKEAKVAARPKANAARAKAPEREAEDEEDEAAGAEDDDDAEEENEPAPKKKAAAKKASATAAKADNKPLPEGKANALKGLKLLFTGTFESMDRKGCAAVAKKYGATLITKLEETDYVVLGVRAGSKKLEEIEAKGLETIDEPHFLRILNSGVPKQKRDRMAAKAAEGAGEPPKKKAKK